MTPSRPRSLAFTPRAYLLGGLAFAFILSGIVSQNPTITFIGSFILSLIALAAFSALAARRRVAQATLSLTLPPSLMMGRAEPLTVTMRLPNDLAINDVTLTPLPATLALSVVPLPTASTSPLAPRFSLTGHRAGDAWLDGALVSITTAVGLCTTRAFISARARTRILPRALTSAAHTLGRSSTLTQRDSGPSASPHRGLGLELRELRDLVPGDPFKSIAWRATARRGKLTAREYQRDADHTYWLLVDTSPSLFWGPVGAAPIDHTVAAAADLIQRLSSRRDLLGLVVFDAEVRALVPLGRGLAHKHQLEHALLEAPQLFHEDRTSITTAELGITIANWLRRHAGDPHIALAASDLLSLPPHLIASPWAEDALTRACAALLGSLPPADLPTRPLTPYSPNPAHATWRTFARAFGLALPHAPGALPGAQARGLLAALEATARERRAASDRTFIALTDLYTAHDRPVLERLCAQLIRRRDQLTVIEPAQPPLPAPASPLEAALLRASALERAQATTPIRSLLRAAGVQLHTLTPTRDHSL